MTNHPFRRYFRRRTLVVGFLAVLIPLAVLMTLQFRWLASLEKTSAIAEKAWLDNYLEAVSSEIEYFYRTQAERSLNMPAYLFTDKHRHKIDSFLRRESPEGASYLFAVPYLDREKWGKLHVYDIERQRFGPPADLDALQAIGVSIAPWGTLAFKGSPVPSHDITTGSFDPDNRVILNPITDNACQLLGVTGMVVDGEYFVNTVLPAAVDGKLHKFFDAKSRGNLVVSVRDGMDRLMFGQKIDDPVAEQVTGSIPFLFDDWTVAIGSRYASPERLAKTNFVLNMSLSIVLAVVLLAGIALAFRTASHEIRLSEMKSDFVSNVSHELRTPLASIRVFGEFLKLGRVEDPQKITEYGEYIETESRRLTQLIDNILDFAKIESGAKTYEFRRVDIRPVVQESLRTLSVGLKHRGIELTYEEAEGPFPPLRVDPDAIGQAVANLVDNAVKYSGESHDVKIRLERTDGEIVIGVLDRGIGISGEQQDKIFERFHRGGTSLVHDVKGSGLGLSIVTHIVQAHGGRVTVESQPGRGSTFSIHLPCSPPSVADARPAGASEVPSLEELGKI